MMAMMMIMVIVMMVTFITEAKNLHVTFVALAKFEFRYLL